MRVEIHSLERHVARCRVYDDRGRHIDFACGAGEEAHRALVLIIRNAVRILAEAEIDRQMAAFGGTNAAV